MCILLRSRSGSVYLGLEPIDKLDNVRVLKSLEHIKLVIYHLFIALDIFLENDLDGDLTVGAVSLTDDAIGSGAECLAKLVFRS